MFDKVIKTIPAAIWTAMILYLCFLPGEKIPKDEFLQKIFFDKFVHFVFYYTLFKFLQFAGWIDKKSSIIICVVLGLFVEIIQHFYIPNRHFSLGDIAVNILGCGLAYYFTSEKKEEESSNKTGIYFKNLDALRAIGCWYVTFVHMLGVYSVKTSANLPVQKGSLVEQFGQGFLTVFFVLSGFLISYFLIKEKTKTNKIAFKKFYIRRAFRILPIYLVGLFLAFGFYKLVCAKGAPGLENGMDYCNSIDKIFLLYLFMIPNVAYSIGAFFPHISNYWSVGVEEQFYIAWPIVLHKTKNILKSFAVIYIGYFIVLLIALVLYQFYKTDNYYKFFDFVHHARFGAFAGGGFLAYIIINLEAYKSKYPKVYLFLISKKTQIASILLLLLAAYINNIYFYAFKHVFIIIPCVFIILFNMINDDNNIFKIDNKFLNYVGLTTYSMYILNQIFLDVFVGMGIGIFGAKNFIMVPLFSMGMLTLVSIASYKYIELTFMNIRGKYFA